MWEGFVLFPVSWQKTGNTVWLVCCPLSTLEGICSFALRSNRWQAIKLHLPQWDFRKAGQRFASNEQQHIGIAANFISCSCMLTVGSLLLFHKCSSSKSLFFRREKQRGIPVPCQNACCSLWVCFHLWRGLKCTKAHWLQREAKGFHFNGTTVLVAERSVCRLLAKVAAEVGVLWDGHQLVVLLLTLPVSGECISEIWGSLKANANS